MVLRRSFTWLTRALMAVLLLAFAASVWLAFGYIEGREICPDTFQVRSFSYWQPPFSPVGFGRSVQVDDQFAIALALTGTFSPAAHRRWDLMQDNYSESGPQADLSSRYLSTLFRRSSTSSKFHWEQWSEDHPELAKRFWPWIQRLAGDNLYIVLPELFCWAEFTPIDDPVIFEQALIRLIVTDVRALREDAAASGLTDALLQLEACLTHYESLRVK